MAPGMALMFLMFTVTYGGRSLLAERTQGTLPRLLVTPTAISQILGGKVLGIFLTGTAQMATLIGASFLFFPFDVGRPAGRYRAGAGGGVRCHRWGLLLTSISRTQAQVANMGTALMLIFSILGGSFFDLANLPDSVQMVSRLTPNRWGMDGSSILALGGGLGDLGPTLLGLLSMGIVLFGVGVLVFNRSAILQK